LRNVHDERNVVQERFTQNLEIIIGTGSFRVPEEKTEKNRSKKE
jgi:hypothetical protein